MSMMTKTISALLLAIALAAPSAALPSASAADDAKLEAVEGAQWIGINRMIVSAMNDEGRADYIMYAWTGVAKPLLQSAGTSELVVSPDGKQAAYTDANGQVLTIDLKTRETTVRSTDTSIKSELQWSADGKTLYFLQGDKNSVIAAVNEDGSIAKLLEDKVDYKSNLRVEGGVAVYAVTKPAKVTADDKKPVEADDVSIDLTGTEPQVYMYDFAGKADKAVQLTTSTDEKPFLALAPNGTAYYVSVPAEGSGKLIAVKPDKTTAEVAIDGDVLQTVQAGGVIYALATTDTDGAIYAIDPRTGNIRTVTEVPSETSEMYIHKGIYEPQVAILADGKIHCKKEGIWTAVTN